MAGKRRLDDKATWRTDKWGMDAATEAARAERVFDPNDTVTDDPTAGGIGGGTSFAKDPVKQVAQLRTDLNDDPSQMVSKAYK